MDCLLTHAVSTTTSAAVTDMIREAGVSNIEDVTLNTISKWIFFIPVNTCKLGIE